MRYTFSEYAHLSDSFSSRAEIYSDNDTAANLLSYHLGKNAIEIRVSECVQPDDHILPMPDVLMTVLDKKLSKENSRSIVTGIDAYLSLLDEKNVKAFMSALHRRIDDGKLNAAYLLGSDRFDDTEFRNPKYKDSLQIVHIHGNGKGVESPFVNVAPQKWLRDGIELAKGWRSLLERLGQFQPTGTHTLALDNFFCQQAGLSTNVIQILDVAIAAERFYKFSAKLPAEELETLILKCKESDCAPHEFLRMQFGQKNMNVRSAPKRLYELRKDVLWPAYAWLLRTVIDDQSYLAKVLAEDVTGDSFVRYYVCDATINLLSHRNTVNYARERASAINEFGGQLDNLVSEFSAKTDRFSDNEVAPWLNCMTNAEHVEILRRVSRCDLTTGLPYMWREIYPMLSFYITEEYDYANRDIAEYFREYRILKIKNCVTAEFVRKSFDSVLPQDIEQRDVLLQQLSCNEKTALLVVDGMGAEYYPLLLAYADAKAMNVDSAKVAEVRLPTSTHFNKIPWDPSRRLASVYGIDNISHYGAERYESNSFEQNIVAALFKFEGVFNRVSEGLMQYERVVVTADHGSSNLAVLAQKNGMAETLPWGEQPLHGRYAIAPANAKCPTEFESYYDTDSRETYWVVRGYNRLPKQGNFAVHGGGTFEERLVPVVIFSTLKSSKVTKPSPARKREQLVEKDGFDI